ncbi:MAG: hypothetical protein JM58_13815 [Peptococcaceae bacterium BICA1-8]|nr:MAG: hypothetical protein JM58_13815 [Peptococcaceae bacterium BICA1-8]
MKKLLFKEKLRSSKPLLGMFMLCPTPELIEILGYTGFDYGVVDLEHGAINEQTAVNMVRAAASAGISPLIRVADSSAVNISKALDMKPEGIVIPGISSKEVALKAVNAARFYPHGNRGANPFVRANHYGSRAGDEYFSEVNEKTSIILLIEGKSGIDNIESILDVGGIDGVTIGPYDLSQSLGIPGDVNNKKVLDEIDKIINICSEMGIPVGIFTTDPNSIRVWIEKGFKLISFSVDTKVFYDACKSFKDNFSSTPFEGSSPRLG